jgi:hypothetical protein
MVKNSCKSMRIWEYTPVADGEKQLQINTNLGIFTSPIKKNSCRSIRIWKVADALISMTSFLSTQIVGDRRTPFSVMP